MVSASVRRNGLSVPIGATPSSVGLIIGYVPSALYLNSSTAEERPNPPPPGSLPMSHVEFIRECTINRNLATDIMSDELRYYLNIRNANIDLDSYERIAL